MYFDAQDMQYCAHDPLLWLFLSYCRLLCLYSNQVQSIPLHYKRYQIDTLFIVLRKNFSAQKSVRLCSLNIGVIALCFRSIIYAWKYL